MMTPVVRMVAAALGGAGGVNDVMAAMVLDDAADGPLPALVEILNTVENNEAVEAPTQDNSPVVDDWPVMVIACQDPAKVEMTGVKGKAWDVPNFITTVAYVSGDTMDPAKAWTHADYAFRAAVIALNNKLYASDQAASRVRGKVMIVKNNSITYGQAARKLTKGRIVGAMLLDNWIRVQP